MPGDKERGGLVGLKRPLVSAAPLIDPALERTILPPDVTERDNAKSEPANHAGSISVNTRELSPTELSSMAAEMTKPATFHLPLALLQRLRATCRLKNTTMVEFVRHAIEEALVAKRPTRDDIAKLLGSEEP